MKVSPFQNLSFEIDKGKFMGIAGPSGIGKSSILKCIYRTYLPTSGEIKYESAHYGSIDLAKAAERQISYLRKNEISYVSQFLKVIRRVSAVDVVAEKLLPSGLRIEEARMQAEEMLERLRIPRKLIQAYPATFSGGEQQRINLARAFIVRPRLLILDEPTASLDRETKQSVLELLSEMKEQGTTMIGVFHDWEVMERIADNILDLQAFVLERV
jgi:alpha-D-ribose 1-methylphosphonate 5-triphosphate synthase subunit PhnL